VNDPSLFPVPKSNQESGTATISFDVLLKILVILGFDYRVVMKKAA
jgi:hypothetical protein